MTRKSHKNPSEQFPLKVKMRLNEKTKWASVKAILYLNLVLCCKLKNKIDGLVRYVSEFRRDKKTKTRLANRKKLKISY